jgi:excisionase family DNA binding protein
MTRLLLRPREAADALGISERTLFTFTKAGRIPKVRIGTRGVRYAPEVLAEIRTQLGGEG